ncbi:MAG: PQQ-binding-like beta-propeller repeat protein [Planctomycetota bacterium]
MQRMQLAGTLVLLACTIALAGCGGTRIDAAVSGAVTASADRVTGSSTAAASVSTEVRESLALAQPAVADPADLGDWPCFLGPTHNSVSTESPDDVLTEWPAAGPPELWRIACGEGYSTPLIRDGRLVLFHRVGNEEVLECLDAESGQPLWRFSYPTAYQCSVAYSSGPYSTPVLTEDRVYAMGAEGQFLCLDIESGELLWQRDLHDEYCVTLDGFYPVAASPLLEEDRLILNLGGSDLEAGVIALDAATGRTLWHAGRRHYSYATPTAATVRGERLVFVWAREALLCLRPATGEVLWEHPFSTNNKDRMQATAPAVWGNLVLLTGYAQGSVCLHLLDRDCSEEIWRDPKTLDVQYNNLLLSGGFAYGLGSIDNCLRCVDITTGQLVWKSRWRSGRGAWSIAVGDRMILWGEKGHLGSMVIDPSRPTPLSMTEKPLLEGPCFPAPALSGGRLYLRNNDTLLCLNLRKEASHSEVASPTPHASFALLSTPQKVPKP